MKLKFKNKIHSAEQKQSNKKALSAKTPSWEMSAQDALRVDYVQHNRRLPLNHN